MKTEKFKGHAAQFLRSNKKISIPYDPADDGPEVDIIRLITGGPNVLIDTRKDDNRNLRRVPA